MAIELQIRVAIRDAVNRKSRRPFHWGGLLGYQQLTAIGEALDSVPAQAETIYLQRLAMQVNRALERSRVLAADLSEAHSWLRRIADCLQYPYRSASPIDEAEPTLCSVAVRVEMETLLASFQPDLKRREAQRALFTAWHRLWKSWGPNLLHCYDIPGLPADNLQLESLFGKLRCNQRRISGRKSTRPLRDFGQYQVLFAAESEAELLEQLRQVPVETYQQHRERLAQAEVPRQQSYRLHRNPAGFIRRLVDQHTARRATLAPDANVTRIQ